MPPPPGLRLLVFPSSNSILHHPSRMTSADSDLPAPRVRQISTSSSTCLGSPTVVDIAESDLPPEEKAGGRGVSPEVACKATNALPLHSAPSPDNPHQQHNFHHTTGGNSASLHPLYEEYSPFDHSTLIGAGNEPVLSPHPDETTSLDAFPGDAEYYSATSDDDCNSISEHSEPYHNHRNSLPDFGGYQPVLDHGTMDTRISDAPPSRPGSRLSNKSPDESSDEVRWLDKHFELIGSATPASPSHTCMEHSNSHPLDSVENGNASGPLRFPDVRIVSLPAQSLLSRSPANLSLAADLPPQELGRISYSCGESMPGTPATTYTLDLEHDAHIPTSLVAQPPPLLRFTPRSAILSANETFPASAAIVPHDNHHPTLGESPQRETNIVGLPDVSIAIEFVAEDAQTHRPTFTSRITASEASQHAVSVRTDARVALNDASRSLKKGDTSSPRAAQRGGRSRAMSLSQKLGSFVARRLSMNRARSHSTSADPSAPPHHTHRNTIVTGTSVSHEGTNARASTDPTTFTNSPSDLVSGEGTRRYTLVLEVDVDVSEGGLAVASAPVRARSLAVPRSPSSRTSFQASPSPSPNSRTSFDVDLASASHCSSSPYSPRVSFSPMPSSPLATSAAEMDTVRPCHEQKLSHRSDALRILSSVPSQPASGSGFDNSTLEPTMTVTIERDDDAGPLARLIRRMSIGRSRRRSATTSFVLASTRVLPVPEYTVEHARFELPEPDMNELDSATPDVGVLTPTNEHTRRWSAPAGPTVPRHLSALAVH